MALPVTPRWSSPSQTHSAADDDVNVEYLKNVLLNFMEHKERRVSIASLCLLTVYYYERVMPEVRDSDLLGYVLFFVISNN